MGIEGRFEDWVSGRDLASFSKDAVQHTSHETDFD
jgi:hypothetical protein